MSAPELYPYQKNFIAQFRRVVDSGTRRVLGVSPTGSGKTVIFAEIVRFTAAARKPALIISHRREIVTESSKKLRDLDLPHGIILAGTPPRPLENVQVAAIQTLYARAIRADRMPLPPADLLIIDEAHHAPAATYQKIIGAYPNATLLGLTATPCRSDGRGLGSIFQTMIEAPQVATLIAQKYLVGTKVFAPIDPDLRGVRTIAGDYNEKQLAERMDRPQLVGDIVTHWHKFGERRKTVCFATSVAHSIHIRDEFVKSGVGAEHVDGTTPKPERDATLARLESGEIELVTNCAVLSEGWNLPAISCCVLARPTKQMGLFRQMIGRVLRPAGGKTDAIVLDHSGAVFRHGFVEDRVEWTLDPDKKAIAPKHVERCEHPASRLIKCSQCGVVGTAGDPCWNCGFMPQRRPRAVDFIDGDLALVNGSRHANGAVYDSAERNRWHGMLAYIADERGYKAGWAAHKYREKFGLFPAWGASPEPIPPSPEVRSWARSRQIAFAMRQVA